MLNTLRQKYLLESILLALMLTIAIYARTRLPEQGTVAHIEREALR